MIKQFSEQQFRKNYHDSDGSCSYPSVLSYHCFKQANKNESTKYRGTFIASKVTSTQKRESHFSLVCIMEFRIMFSCLGKLKAFPVNLIRLSLSTFSVCMRTINKLYALLTGFILFLKKTVFLFNAALLKYFIYSRVRHLNFSMVQQFLL